MVFSKIRLSAQLFAFALYLKLTAWRHPSFKARLKEKDLTVQIKVLDNSLGRYFIFHEGKIISKGGIYPKPDVTMGFSDAALGARLLLPWRNQMEQTDAMKQFRLTLEGPDELTYWFMETLSLTLNAGIKWGTDMGKGVTRYVNNSNAGPMFVYVKAGKIIRMTPIEFDSTDAPSFTIEARGKKFTPPRKTTMSPYGFSFKSTVYSPDRILYPMKRVDFDPNGERNCENRGVSGYERISWDEALEIVANEIKRVKRDYGPGAILSSAPSHHTWGNIGYYLSTHRRFMNAIGTTSVAANPDSWEGWFWGATHHWGDSMRQGGAEGYGTVEDALKECEMMVFWSSDPESNPGSYCLFRKHRPTPVATGAGRENGAHQPLLRPHGRADRREMDCAPAGHGKCHVAGNRIYLDKRKSI